MAENYVLKMYNQWANRPLGKRLFSLYAARKAPYFASVSPLVTDLKPGQCEVFLKKRKRLQNHIGTMHVIAIANGLEMAMGFMAEASIPKHLRWIPKGMDIQYVSKGETDMRCFARLENNAWEVGDLDIEVVALDKNDKPVVAGTITLWITEKPPKS